MTELFTADNHLKLIVDFFEKFSYTTSERGRTGNRDEVGRMDNKQLIMEAKAARNRAYAPYSGYKVGAALLTKSGKVYHGCNIENAGFTPTVCAERTAFFRAVWDGERDFEKIAVVGAAEEEKVDTMCAPCGVCRQVMMEFCDPDTFRIVMANGKDKELEITLKDLLPYGFGPDNL